MKKGFVTDHVNFILDLYNAGVRPWKIALWDKRWTKDYVRGIVSNAVRRGDPRGKPKNHRKHTCLSKEEFMKHHPCLFVGIGYRCLRCKATCDEEKEFESFACTGDIKDYPKVGRPKKPYDPMKRIINGRKWSNKNR